MTPTTEAESAPKTAQQFAEWLKVRDYDICCDDEDDDGCLQSVPLGVDIVLGWFLEAK